MVALALTLSCVTTIGVEVLRPSEMGLHRYHKLALLPFGFPTQDYESTQLLDDIFERRFDLTNQNSQNRHERNLVAKLQDGIREGIRESVFFQLMEAPQSPDEITESGVEAFVTGRLVSVDSKTETGSKEEEQEDGTVTSTPFVERTVVVLVEYMVLDAISGELVAIQRKDFTKSFQARSAGDLRSSDLLQEQAVEEALQVILKDLLPYTQWERRTLKSFEGENAQFELARELVLEDSYQEALDLFEKVYQETGSLAAGYNAAILTEVLGNRDEAILQLEILLEETGEPYVGRELNRMRQQKADEESFAG